MGNCPRTTQHEPAPTEIEPNAKPSSPRKYFGVSGLLELGFEYRPVSCCNGSCEKATKNCCFQCTTRLFHVASNTMINARNRKEFISDGPKFDEIACICQEISIERLKKDHSLKSIIVCDDPDQGDPVHALVNDDDGYFRVADDDHGKDSVASNPQQPENPRQQQQQPTLIIITGKGKSRAGILSIKELLHSGYESGSAARHVMAAKQRGWNVVLLDPNARGVPNGMETVDRSLTRICSYWKNRTPPIYVLAHSAAGGYFVRYLLLGQARLVILKNLQAICFSDSTHNIQWAREDSEGVFDLLQSNTCLYIRNNTIRASEFKSNHDYKPGENADVDHWWRRRFGKIPTVWAGTPDHSLVCAVAREVIWSFFDEHKHQRSKYHRQLSDLEASA